MRRAAVALFFLATACGSPPPAPSPSLPPPPSPPLPPPAPFPRPFTGPLDAAAFFPRVGDRWVRANTLPDVPSITSALTADATGALSLDTTNGPARVRVTPDEIALLDGRDHVIEVWLHAPIEVGTTWTDAGAPLGCTSTILTGPHEETLFGRPLPACITIRATCRGHDDASLHMDTWCAGLGRVRSHVTETSGGGGGSYETHLSAFATGGETVGDTPAAIEALGALPSVTAPLP